MKYTITEFAQEIRRMYPGDYNDLSDQALVNLWLKKYPNDRDKIDFNVKKKEPVVIYQKSIVVEREPVIIYQNTIETEPKNHQTNWGSQVIKVGLILALLVFSYLKNPTQEDFILKVTTEASNNNIAVDMISLGITVMFSGGLNLPSIDRTDLLIFSVYHLEIKNDTPSKSVNVRGIGFWDHIFLF